jgi:hypothetical protein
MRALATIACAMAVAAVAGFVPPAHAAGDEFLADPTRPVDFSAGGGGAPVNLGPALQSTRLSATQKSATIDGNVYHVGDRFAGSEIIDIRPYEVVLQARRRGGAAREWHLRMVPKLSKAPDDAAAPGEIKIKKAEPRAGEVSK